MEARRGSGAFVGRAAELAALEQAVEDARRGAPSVVLVGGDAGIGKSRLVGEAARRSGAPAHLGRCVPVGGDAIPLAPLVDLLRQVRRSSPSALDGPGLAPLGHLLGTGDRTASPGAAFDATSSLVGRLAADGGVIVGFEDLHWADAATWDLFGFLARNLVDDQAVLVATFRANEISADPVQRRRLAELARLPAVRRVHLGGLGRSEVAEQVAALVGAGVDPALVEEVAARGQGNPLFTEELVVAHAAGETVPVLLSDLFAAEIEALGERTGDVLGVVATVGRSTPHDLLAEVVGGDDRAVEEAVRPAIAAHVLVLDAGGESYAFRHPLIGEVVAAGLLPSQRRRLHRRIADVLAAHPGLAASPSSAAGELAFHLDRAGDAAGAFAASLEAADVLAPVAQSAALAHLERALELWDEAGGPPRERGRRTWEAAELAYTTGRGERAVELAVCALAEDEPPRGEAWGHERLARYLWTAGRLDESAAEYDEAAGLVDEADRSVDAAAVFAGLAQGDLLVCRYDRAERWCRLALEVVTGPDVAHETWVHARRILGAVRSHLGDTDEGVELCRSAIEAARIADDRALATIYLVEVLLQAGRYEEAVTAALDGAAEGQRAGFDRSMGGYLTAMAVEGLTRLGRWSEAAAVLAPLAGLATVPATSVRRGLAAAVLAARRGEAERAGALLAEARTQPTDPWHRLYVHAATAEVHLLAGDSAGAAAAADEAWSDGCGWDRRWPARYAMLGAMAAVERALDDLARRAPVDAVAVAAAVRDRLDAARAACAREDGSVTPDVQVHLDHGAAAATRLAGPDPDAWAMAAAGWDRLGDRFWAAVARLREAEAAALAGAPARAGDALRAAHAAAVDLGAASLAAEVEAVARRTRLSVEAPAPAPLDRGGTDAVGLTSREAEVLALVAGGQTNRQIGEALYVSEKTVSVHVSNILRKLGVASRVEAAAVAQRLGIG